MLDVSGVGSLSLHIHTMDLYPVGAAMIGQTPRDLTQAA
jgi:hypothetical protein